MIRLTTFDEIMEDYARGIRAILDPDRMRLGFKHEMPTVDEYRHLRMAVYSRQEYRTSRYHRHQVRCRMIFSIMRQSWA
ncbi:hypothetical protein ASE23_29005 [Rhizobium sp. Root73]|uniref:hypothetical protein n=1 Tax=unclassified Rhizobium TaxID=2613769 RepID=UPI00072BC7D2|nr:MULTISPECIES: hypothetical protein [unclassified Rhizobium]KQY08901.1 hypothetical protein ASD36_28730 [Rhizobium sp. Root1334]KRC03240.1 hypothetical protein ASE23_29005 [Rhizobium sp. Root73]